MIIETCTIRFIIKSRIKLFDRPILIESFTTIYHLSHTKIETSKTNITKELKIHQRNLLWLKLLPPTMSKFIVLLGVFIVLSRDMTTDLLLHLAVVNLYSYVQSVAIKLVKVSFDEAICVRRNEWKVEKKTWMGEDGRKLEYDSSY